MKDEDVERMLRKYRPAAPSGELRDRVLEAALEEQQFEEQQKEWSRADWVLAAVAAGVVIAAIGTAPGEPALMASAEHLAYRTAVERVANELGGDDGARMLALMVVPAPESVAADEQQVAP